MIKNTSDVWLYPKTQPTLTRRVFSAMRITSRINPTIRRLVHV